VFPKCYRTVNAAFASCRGASGSPWREAIKLAWPSRLSEADQRSETPVTDEERAATGWYIWCGEQLSDAPDFFKPLCVDHLLDALPVVADFLALPQAFAL
jgi:hypothetical protein